MQIHHRPINSKHATCPAWMLLFVSWRVYASRDKAWSRADRQLTILVGEEKAKNLSPEIMNRYITSVAYLRHRIAGTICLHLKWRTAVKGSTATLSDTKMCVGVNYSVKSVATLVGVLNIVIPVYKNVDRYTRLLPVPGTLQVYYAQR